MNQNQTSESFISFKNGLNPDNQDLKPRFIIGIDLGTTNSAVAYIDTENAPKKIVSFPILQMIAPHLTEKRLTLPSFVSLTSTEMDELPWKNNFDSLQKKKIKINQIQKMSLLERSLEILQKIRLIIFLRQNLG